MIRELIPRQREQLAIDAIVKVPAWCDLSRMLGTHIWRELPGIYGPYLSKNLDFLVDDFDQGPIVYMMQAGNVSYRLSESMTSTIYMYNYEKRGPPESLTRRSQGMSSPGLC